MKTFLSFRFDFKSSLRTLKKCLFKLLVISGGKLSLTDSHEFVCRNFTTEALWQMLFFEKRTLFRGLLVGKFFYVIKKVLF